MKRVLVLLISSLLVISSLAPGLAQAETIPTNSSSVVISQIQTGGTGTGTATQEFVELYNNSEHDVNITSLCIFYVSASGSTSSELACFITTDASITVWLKANSFITITSAAYETATGYSGDVTAKYTGLAATGGYVEMRQAEQVLEAIAWGVVANINEKPAPAPVGGKALQRKNLSGILLQDTNISSDDFVIAEPLHHDSGLYEIETITDVCPNIEGAQTTLPLGYYTSTNGDCMIIPPTDVCPNIPEVQITIPLNYELVAGECIGDVCSNVRGLQTAVPQYYEQIDSICTRIPLPKILITELLPNPSGTDSGNEYIELYNPNSFSVALGQYKIAIGPNFENVYTLPADITIIPGGYVTITNAVIGYTLVNTTSRAQLLDQDNVVIDQSVGYTNATDGMAWALFSSGWQYTNRPTPAAVNTDSVENNDDEETFATSATTLTPCEAGKYRNSLTNRCRNIESDASVLANCDADEYRNPDTNRCRKIVTTAASLTSCAADQERNPNTNRCRAVASASTLAACKEGQERNPATNRCRNIAAAVSASDIPFAVTPTATQASTKIGWLVAGIALLGALGYAAYEWRGEAGRFFQKFLPVKTGKK